MRLPTAREKAAGREHALAALIHIRAAYRACEAAEEALGGAERETARLVCLGLAGAGKRLRKLALVIGVPPDELEDGGR